MLCESLSKRCRSLGIACMGTLPGSVRLVLACEAKDIIQSTVYSMPRIMGIPSVIVSMVTVKAEYIMSSHTMQDMMEPA
jgi:hypothetical protein